MPNPGVYLGVTNAGSFGDVDGAQHTFIAIVHSDGSESDFEAGEIGGSGAQQGQNVLGITSYGNNLDNAWGYQQLAAPDGQSEDQFENSIEQQFTNYESWQLNGQAPQYDVEGADSNTFVSNILAGAGVDVSDSNVIVNNQSAPGWAGELDPNLFQTSTNGYEDDPGDTGGQDLMA